MARLTLLASAVLVFLVSGALAATLPTKVTCVSLSQPEGALCKERLTFSEAGPFVAIRVDDQTPLRLAFVISGTVLSAGLIAAGERHDSRRHRLASTRSTDEDSSNN